MARANHEATGGGNSAKRKLANTLQMFRDLGHSTKELIAGKSADEDEDSEYLKARALAATARLCVSSPCAPWVLTGREILCGCKSTQLLRHACVAEHIVCPADTGEQLL